jgi:hypothetical protein
LQRRNHPAGFVTQGTCFIERRLVTEAHETAVAPERR